ncbi:MAG TPA: DUF6538 domain-containing protein [Trinickia sp.]|uniref:DUF6538 domain-containing protein n=1 Tax=Trinickia sp. TaxID=2571163 RepID=UPI002B995136|nr:DUF6538 domain-containing protein [Trinickia sp.]HTI16635.1 DUF6538 domain-containing protein [Trinickia sp.]
MLRVTLRCSYDRGGTIYFRRAVPDDLQDRRPATLVKVNWGTGDVRVAARKIEAINRRLEAEWTLFWGRPHPPAPRRQT